MKFCIDKSGWKTVSLGDVAYEYSRRINNPSESGYDRFVGNSNIGQWDFKINSWESTESVTSAMKLFSSKDYLFVRRSLYASDFRERAPRADFDGVCSGDIITIRENSEIIIDGFLIGLLNSPDLWRYVVANASGSITRRIKWKDLERFEFQLPPKNVQEEITRLLWSLNAVIEQRAICLDKATTLVLSTLKNHFSGLDVEYVTLGDAGKWLSGGTPSKENKAYWDGDIPWVSPKDMKRDFIDSSIDKITQKAVNDGAILVPKNSLLVVVRGMILAHSFPVALNTEEVSFNQDMRALLVSEEFIPEYILYYLQYKKDFVVSIATTTTHGTKRLAMEDLLQLPLPKPSIETQKNFIEVIKSIRTSMSELVTSIESSKTLKKVLIEQVF